MKRLTTLLAAILFTTGMVFAQNNTATSTSNGNNNESEITQTGSNNTAEVFQGIQSITSNNDEATIEQVGDGNSAALKSRDGWGNSPSSVIYDVYQVGNNNTANATAFNAPASADIDQVGNNNSANLVQHTSDQMSTKLSQTGVGNEADIKQTLGADNSVMQASFTGDYNTMTVTQTNGAWQKMVIGVTGDDNTITGTLGGHDADQFTSIFGSDNTFDFYQDKSSDAGISITGDLNDVDLMQNGIGNSVFATVPWDKNGIVVNGMDNDVSVTQNSNYNTATVNVYGNGNSATVNQ